MKRNQEDKEINCLVEMSNVMRERLAIEFLSSGQTDQTFHVTCVKQMFDPDWIVCSAR